jgi:uncharacterized protein YceH (UPF0502 family)
MTPVQQRLVGCHVEKELTTPDQYPLSMNALIAACNQSTNRDPVVQLDERVVSNALENLKAEGLVRVVFSKGNRVDKYRHVLPEAHELDRPSLAVITVLLLRGPQTAAELRTRAERLHAFAGTHEVEHVLAQLAGRDAPLVTLLPRQPGRKEPRWAHLLGAAAAVAPTPVPEPEDPSAVGEPYVAAPRPDERIVALEERVRVLEERLAQLDG